MGVLNVLEVPCLSDSNELQPRLPFGWTVDAVSSFKKQMAQRSLLTTQQNYN